MCSLSILMSTYNGEKYLETQLKSIFNQTYTDFQLVIRDDGSNDNTVLIIEEYIKKYPNRIIFHQGKNVGVRKSFWELIQYTSNSTYFAFCDQDDVWKSDKIQNAVSKLENFPTIPACYFSNGELVDKDLNSLHKDIYHDFDNIHKVFEKFENDICYIGAVGCTMVFNNILRNCILRKKFPDGIIMHDVFMLSVCATLNGKIIYDKYKSVYYRQHSSNTIGCKPGFFNGLKYRINYIFEKKDNSIQSHAIYILNEFNKFLPEHEKNFLKLVSTYNNSLCAKLKLAFNKNLTFCDLKTEVFIRLTLLLGKR